MPDGDRFERKFKGKGWQRLYRLLCNTEDHKLLTGAAMRGVAAYIRKTADVRFDGFISAIHEALTEPVLNEIPPESALSGHSRLNAQLENLVAEHEFAVSAHFAKRAAWRVCLNLDSEREYLTEQDVASEFAAELSWEIVESQCVAIGRENVARKRKRNYEQQMEFENSFRKALAEQGRKLGNQLCTEDVSHTRAPKSTARRKFTLEDLHKPLSAEGEIS